MSAAVSEVAGVVLAKVDKKVVAAALAVLKLEAGGTVEEQVKRLAKHFRKKPNELADCSKCGGDSQLTFRLNGKECCPYCGAGDDAPSNVVPMRPAAANAPAHSERDLDKSLDRIRKLRVGAGVSIWQLGLEIRLNYEQELWKLRTDKDGSLRYRSFRQFAAQELGMSHTYAYRLMDISAAFTQQEIEQIGTAKLGVILELPEPHRSKLLERARDGATTNELKGEAAEARGKKQKPALPKGDNITVAVALGRTIIPLLARPKKAGAAPSAARNLTDDPWAEELLLNGVKTMYHVRQNSNGELVLVVERRRV